MIYIGKAIASVHAKVNPLAKEIDKKEPILFIR